MTLLRLTQRHTSKDASVKDPRHMLLGFVGFLFLLGCTMNRPEQDNYLVDAKGIGGEVLARELASRLKAEISTTTLTLPDSDRAEMFRLDGQGFSLILMPLPDDRCNTKASFHSTYNDQQLRIDLIYNSLSAEDRAELKRALQAVADKLHAHMQPFEEC